MISKKSLAATIGIIIIPLLAIVIHTLMTQPPEGVLHLKTINGEADIVYEEPYHVPSINGTTDEAVSYALGFVHATDRLYDLQLRRACAYGKLSEMFGETALSADKFVRSLQYSSVVDGEWENLPSRQKSILQSYAAGINAFVKQSKMLPLEFQYLGISFNEWLPKDSLMIFKQFSFEMSNNWQLIMLRTLVKEKVGEYWAEKIFPFDEADSFVNDISIVDQSKEKEWQPKEPQKEVIHPRREEPKPDPPKREEPKKEQPKVEAQKKEEPKKEEQRKEEPKKEEKRKDWDDDELESADEIIARLKAQMESATRGDQKPGSSTDSKATTKQGNMKGSNAWVIGGKFTESKKPLLANDPHMAHKNPSFFYLATLVYPFKEIITGATIVGVPVVVIGRNTKVAWGITSSMIENMDLFTITLNEKANQYYHAYRWKDLIYNEEEIKIKGQKSLFYKTYKTHHGPIIDYPEDSNAEKYLHIGGAVPLNHTLALAWEGFKENDQSFSEFTNLNFATKVGDVESSLQGMHGFAASFIYADDHDNIGYWASGKLPHKEQQKKALYAINGSHSDGDWINFLPKNMNPHKLNPKEGYIVSCNNRIMARGSLIGASIPTTSRAIRAAKIINEYIKSGKKITINDMKDMQQDVIDEYAKKILPILLKIVEQHKAKYFENNANVNVLLDQLTSTLSKWECKMAGNDKGALIYNIWISELYETLLKKQLPESEWREKVIDSFYSEHFLGNMINKWGKGLELNNEVCDDSAQFVMRDKCAYNVIKSLLNAYAYIFSEVGKNEQNWEWKVVNKQSYRHIPFSDTFLRYLFHKEIQVGGNRNTLFSSDKHYSTGEVEKNYGPVFRMVTSLDDMTSTSLMGDSGQSGNQASPYYDNMMEALNEGTYFNFTYTPEGPHLKLTQ